jgi:hypothetical protein
LTNIEINEPSIQQSNLINLITERNMAFNLSQWMGPDTSPGANLDVNGGEDRNSNCSESSPSAMTNDVSVPYHVTFITET